MRKESFTILNVDDSMEYLHTHSHILKKEGYNVIEAVNGNECIRMVEEHKPDLILLDVVLPDRNGVEICRQIKNDPAAKHTLVLLISALEIENSAQVFGLDAGADGYLLKPISKQVLLAHVRVMERIKRNEDELSEAAVMFEKRVKERTEKLKNVNKKLQKEIAERKEMEVRIKESEEYYRKLVETSPDGIAIANLEGRIIFGSPRAFEIFGFPKNTNIIDMPILDLVAPEERAKAMERIQRIFSGKLPPSSQEYRLLKYDKSQFWGEINSSRLFDAHGNVTGILVVCRDITERKLAEEDLRRATEGTHAVLWRSTVTKAEDETKGACGYYWDTHFANLDAVQEFLDLPEYPGLSLADRFYSSWFEEDRKELDRISAEALRKGLGRYSQEYRLRDAKGKTHWMYIDARVRRLSEREFDIAGINMDVTERKQTEETLQRSEERFRKLVEGAPAAIVILSSAGKILYTNPKSLIMFDVQGDITAEKPLLDYIAPELRSNIIERYRLHSEGKQIPDQFETVGLRSDGTRFPVHIAVSHLQFHGEDVTLNFVTDITQQKQVEKALRESEAMLSEAMKIAKLGAWEYDVVQDQFKFNDQFYSLFHTTAMQEGGYIMSFARYSKKFVHPDDIAVVGTEIQKALETNDPDYSSQLDHRIIRADGEVGHVNVHIRVEKDAQGRTVKTYGVNQDITVRKRVEDQLLIKDFAVESSVSAIGLTDLQGKLIYANNAYVKMWGYNDAKELMGKNISGFADSKETVNEAIMLLQSGKPYINDNIVRRKDGTLFNVQMTANIVKSYDGTPISMMASFIDITDRIRVEEALRESEVRYRTMIDNSNDLIQSVAPDGNFLFVNPKWLSTMGYCREEIDGLNLFDIINPDSVPHCRPLFQKIMNGDKVPFMEVTFVAKDGRSIVLEGNAAPRMLDGKVIATQSFFHDITERKKTENALQESEIKYRDMVEQINDVIYSADTKGILTYISPTVEVLGGYKPEEMIGRSLEEFIDPVFIPRIQEQFKSVMTGNLKPMEYRVKVKSGDYRWVRSSSKPILKENRPTGMRGVLTDITAQKQAEDFVTLLSHTVKSITECVSVTDLNNKLLFVNRAFLDLYGYSEDEVIGKTVGTLVVPSGIDNRDIINTTIKGGWQGELINRKKDGTEFPIFLSTSVVLDDMGNAIALVGVATDITEQKKLQQELLQSQKMQSIGTLAGGIAHDFNNILGIILAYITSIKMAKDDINKIDLAAETIVKAVDRGKTLVQQILTFARRSDTAFGPVNVNDIVKEIMTMIFETFPKVLTYSQNIDKDILYINADRSQLHQALLNLCVNARDAMPDGGVLTINTRSGITLHDKYPHAAAGGYILIEVSDTGEGMTEETRMRIFEPFFTTKEQGKGTGLGLAVVFGVVQTHKGFIDVKSVPGKGTTFQLYLPASRAAEPINEEVELKLENIPGGTETLLVVEDEEMLMMSLQMILTEKGYNVITAGDGLQAVNTYKKQKNEIALVLTDLGLPKMTGMEECERIKKINPKVRIIIASGYLAPEMKSEFLKAGIRHYLNKPYDLLKVLKMVREVLDGK